MIRLSRILSDIFAEDDGNTDEARPSTSLQSPHRAFVGSGLDDEEVVMIEVSDT